MEHVMIDLETMGTEPGCAICSIGICEFDPYIDPSEWRSGLYVIDWSTWGTLDPSTVKWWLKQSDEARAQILRDGLPLEDVLKRIVPALHRAKYIWANDPDFDCCILEAACRACGLFGAWKYYKHRSVRTVRMIGSDLGIPEIERFGAHTAEADCQYQAIIVSNVLRRLKC